MRIRTNNEYGELQSIILGSVNNGHWPIDDQFFDKMIDASIFYGIVVGSVLAINNLYWLHKKELL